MRLTAAAVLLLASGGAAFAQGRSSDYGAFFMRTFGPAQPRDDADRRWLAEADAVFARVAAVADRKLGREPHLFVMEKPGDPEAQALPDGTIVVNLPLLRFCMAGTTDPERGRARLAFVLGHEMAHLAHHDSWHAEAFATLARHGGPQLVEQTRRWVEETGADRLAKEFQADQAGFSFMTMAGFPADAVLGGQSDFLKAWSDRTGNAALAGQTRAVLAERSRVLKARLRSLEEIVPFFRFGVRLAQLGRFDDALALLRRAAVDFPSREVESNLGMVLLQRALARMAQCGEARAVQFKLPIVIDPDTLAARFRSRTAGQAGCAGAVSSSDLESAERTLDSAVRRDPEYLPARLNLAAVYIVGDQGDSAYAKVREGPRTRPMDPRLALTEAVALYLSRRDSPLDTTDAALEALDELEARCAAPAACPGGDALAAAIRFNRARILQERGRGEAARRAWEAFLGVEPDGPFADEARAALLRAGVAVSVPVSAPRVGRTGADLSKRLTSEARSRLDAAAPRRFTLGDIRGAFRTAPGLEALELGGVVEIIEETLTPPLPADDARRGLGRASAVIEARAGQRTLVFHDVALDEEKDKVVRRVLFQPR